MILAISLSHIALFLDFQNAQKLPQKQLLFLQNLMLLSREGGESENYNFKSAAIRYINVCRSKALCENNVQKWG